MVLYATDNATSVTVFQVSTATRWHMSIITHHVFTLKAAMQTPVRTAAGVSRAPPTMYVSVVSATKEDTASTVSRTTS